MLQVDVGWGSATWQVRNRTSNSLTRVEGVDKSAFDGVMMRAGGVITMMFTDIVNSTGTKAAVGDQPYREILVRHEALIRECVGDRGGYELKTEGDSFFVAFGRPGDAVACAIAIQRRLADNPIAITDKDFLQIRIGIHTGTPIVYRDLVSGRVDLSGTDVDKAARVEGMANGGQVLISEETKILAKSQTTHDWGKWELKGLDAHRIFEVVRPGQQPRQPVGWPVVEPVRFLTKFVGRERELRDVIEMVLHNRLVTLTGMGGIGKTRLADEVFQRRGGDFPDGAAVVQLAETADNEQAVVSKLTVQLGVKVDGFPDEETALRAALQNRRMIVVLDNFESVMSGVSILGRLLHQCPAVHFLVTSQRPLGLDGESEHYVEPMAVPSRDVWDRVEVLAVLESFLLFRDRVPEQKC